MTDEKKVGGTLAERLGRVKAEQSGTPTPPTHSIFVPVWRRRTLEPKDLTGKGGS